MGQDGTQDATSGREAFTEVKELIERDRLIEARRIAEAAHRRSPDHLRLTDLLVGLRQHDGEVDAALELAVHNAERRRDRLAKRRRPQRAERPLQPHERVFICGYFYSGSGAVLDFLTDHDGCEKWTPAGEMRLIKFPGGLDALARQHARAESLRNEDLVDLYLHITGRKVDATPKGSYSRWGMVNRNSRRLHRAPTARGYLLRCYERFLELVERSDQGPITSQELEERLRSWVSVALDAAAADTGADRLIIDQAVTAWRLPLARLVPPSVFLVVHRDPRDQFVEAKDVLERPGRRSTSVLRFAGSYRRRRRHVRSAIPELEREHGHRFLTMSFERFVMEHEDEAAKLIDTLGLHDRPRMGAAFDPSVSRGNVAKHRDALTSRERHLLSLLLRPYLSGHAHHGSPAKG